MEDGSSGHLVYQGWLDKMKMALGRIPVSRKMGKDVLSRMLRVSSTKER